MSTPALPADFLRAIAESFPADFLTREPAELQEYGRDWTRVYAPAPGAVAFPRTTDEVARFMALCHQHRVAVVPSGGRTGLAGGAVAMHGEVVLSLKRMTRMEPVDLLGNTVRVQAGAVTEGVHQHCAPHGLTWPVDFASKGSSTVGGNIATNAGGVKVIRYGLTRQWVLGLQVVTAQGQVLELNGALEKNNTGVDLRQLFIGSEGTLGIITEATLKLTRLPGKQDVFLFAVPDVAAVLRLFRDARQAPLVLSAYEFFTDKCLARVQRHRKLRSPFEAPSGCYVLLESEGGDPAAVEAWLGSLFERGLVTDGTQAQGAAQAQELWSLRESISESLSATGVLHKNDISLPVANLEAFCAELDAVFASRYPGWEICLFGHIGDGNLHVNVMKPDAVEKADFFAHAKQSDHAMFDLVRKHGGSISAEHGIGLLKKDYLDYTRAPGELELLRTLKRALDPAGILNPGKILDA
ncbi:MULTISPECIES: FAD-binding oxidoreductase [Corallococcus]|uniref:FAD-binding oxidoreductase n=2 Tax=Corallococcus TaxID=83461 RepID=A0A7Y4JZ87_9BACT|nr:FAD-binding oxidoreductase [Corallococcus exercitus]NOK13924.1 FAD-binding oxidoreductase [Corallococcus exercitus]GMU06796.1 FAD-binding oxidoreductase [Corallococcus sp. NO1]